MKTTTQTRTILQRSSTCLALAVGVLGGGCVATLHNDSAGRAPAPRPPDTGSAAASSLPATSVSPAELADVEKLFVARRIQPAESLAVRLLGTVGSDGSWALERVEVQRSPGRLVLLPRVRRVPGDNFIQMLVPLDRTVRVALPAGRYRVEARGRAGVVGTEVVVEADAQRTPPQAFVDLQSEAPDGDDLVTSMRLEGRVADGFVDRIEVREVSSNGAGAWHAPEFMERTAAGLQGTMSIRRAAQDGERRVQVRALDGQGTWSPVVESVLRAR
jgi:hypothetical protein